MRSPHRLVRFPLGTTAVLMVLVLSACDNGPPPSAPLEPGPVPTFSRGTTPGMPTPRAPANNAVVTLNTGKLEWSAIEGAQVYRYMIATRRDLLPGDPNATSCTSCVAQGTIGLTSVRLLSLNLKYGTEYAWQVQAVTSRGVRSLWSPRPLFTVGTSSFTWPVDPQNMANGFMGGCGDGTCYWIAPDSERRNPNAAQRWRDSQPFLQSYNSAERGYHVGADYNLGSGAADMGKSVHAAADGVVTYSEARKDRAQGTVAILHLTPEGRFTSYYLHMATAGLPAKGTPVTKGMVIGKIGPAVSGMSPHLHFEIRRGESINMDRGYVASTTTSTPNGQIDPNTFIASHRQ